MSGARVTRRRFITIVAAVAAAPGMAGARELQTFTWHGIALGAQASLTIEHDDAAEANEAIAAALAEVARLEAIFSLARPESALSQLNRSGFIDPAPLDLRVLLGEALQLASLSDGAFDPTVQPLWTLYADHFATRNADPQGPDRARVAAALANVGWRNVVQEASRIQLSRPGMALTLNGIAQGYITDRVGDVLKARGFAHVLVNMGEQLALGPKRSGAAWRIGIADPAAAGALLDTVALDRGAVATSGGYGFHFDSAGRFSHLLDPATGIPAERVQSVTVVAVSACRADGLSTALSIAPQSLRSRLLTDGARAFIVTAGAGQGSWLPAST